MALLLRRLHARPLLCGAVLALHLLGAHAQAPLADRLTGDVGGAAYITPSPVRGVSDTAIALPYAYADWGRFFARVDTLGVKTLPLGYGYLELAARISFEGYRADAASLRGISDRRNPLPIGIGTYQETPLGGFFLNAFYDTASRGALLEASYAAELPAGRWTFYPQIGVERRSARYVSHLYGVTSAESAASGYAAYAPGASTTPVLGLAAEVPLGGPWLLSLQWRRKWFDAAVRNSPLVNSRMQDTGLIALAYRFK
ncbi:MipA/OmpV family protein [Variovorax terrae]|uniref:MipA/OmpV family protein n=1 Tax=Variovorax terrae TaxID=2923278 RepID=A0A9X1VUS2_9BURK|nr:MipA/OmpV family protein [Variovorax terrae]MCJ0763752.1 MipA/OmpV family protein [Variovorax terrae]